MSDTIFRTGNSSEGDHSDRSAGDRQRHREKVREAIQENIADIIADESIIGKSGDTIVKVPIKGIKEFRFKYGDNNEGVSQGNGSSEPGQTIGKIDENQGDDGQGPGGDQPGIDIYETEITLAEIIEIMFEDLELPNLERKKMREIETESKLKRKGYRLAGKRNRLDATRSIREKKRRKISMGLGKAPETIGEEEYEALPESTRNFYIPLGDGRYQFRFPFADDDLVYKHMDKEVRKESNAVLFCIMDTSGSMDTMKKYLARSFFFLLYCFVRSRYRNVEVVFISHHVEANEVTQDEFFHKGESGGTFMSSGMNKAIEIINNRYHPSLWNIYAFYCSDGDNFDSDDNEAVSAAQELSKLANLFGYGEIKPEAEAYPSSRIEMFKNNIPAENFRSLVIHKKEGLFEAFKEFLKADRAEGGE